MLDFRDFDKVMERHNRTFNIMFRVVLAFIAVVVVVMLLAVVKPLITKLLDVIKGNSTALTELKSVLTSTNSNCKDCKKDQIRRFDRIEDKLDTLIHKEE